MKTLLTRIVLTLSMVFFFAGCATSRVVRDSAKAEIIIDSLGNILVYDKRIPLDRVASTALRAGFERNQELSVQVPENPDRRLMTAVLIELRKAGYSRVVFVSEKKATSVTEPAQ
jgi:biopolymer transport protein ExbD